MNNIFSAVAFVFLVSAIAGCSQRDPKTESETVGVSIDISRIESDELGVGLSQGNVSSIEYLVEKVVSDPVPTYQVSGEYDSGKSFKFTVSVYDSGNRLNIKLIEGIYDRVQVKGQGDRRVLWKGIESSSFPIEANVRELNLDVVKNGG